MLPCVLQVELDARQQHEAHHGPPGEAVQRLHHRRVEDEAVVLGKDRTKDAGPEHDTRDDLHYDERREVLSAAESPDEVRQREDQHHRDQEDLGRVHGVTATATVGWVTCRP